MKPVRNPPDLILLLLVLLLLAFGVLLVYDASVVYALDVFGGRYHFLIAQSTWAGIGIVALVVSYVVPLSFYKRFATIIYLISIGLLLFVLIPTKLSPEVYGARRWIIFPIFNNIGFQPSDFAKLATVLFLSLLISRSQKKDTRFLIRFLVFLSIPALLILKEPDFGSSLILIVGSLSALFVSGIPFKYFAFLFPALILFCGFFIFTSPYRRERVASFFGHDSSTYQNNSYHLDQTLITLGSGGIVGRGWGQSRQKYGYLPEVSADSIFSIVGEELGFIGSSALLSVISYIAFRGFKIISNCGEVYVKSLGVGIITMYFSQSFLNIFSQLKILPLTGVPLPLISYGGSSLITTAIGFGVLLSLSREC
jgi:cell division protein FtsW